MNEEFSSSIIIEENSEIKHSGVGIASFILGIISIILFFCIIVISISFATTFSEDEVIQMIIGLITILVFLVSIIGGILGIVSICLKKKKKIFGILGICFNVTPFICVILLLLLGLSQQ